jgi:N-acetylneuraminic acid mutarotase
VTFGGCHSEYNHLNDLNIFELSQFVEAPSSGIVTCTKVNVSDNVPTTRWGHGATVLNQTKLLVLGGRNENDVNDLYCFDIEAMQWQQLDVGHPLPKPRRRHSCILISNCLVMFGGFDGEFFNDLNVLNLQPNFKKSVISESTKDQDFNRLVNSYEASDFKFVIESNSPNKNSTIYGNRGLVLYNLCTKEREASK